MKWHMVPFIIIKSIVLAGVSVGLVAVVLTGFFVGIGYVDDRFGAQWGFFAFVMGCVFLIATIALVCWDVDNHANT